MGFWLESINHAGRVSKLRIYIYFVHIYHTMVQISQWKYTFYRFYAVNDKIKFKAIVWFDTNDGQSHLIYLIFARINEKFNWKVNLFDWNEEATKLFCVSAANRLIFHFFSCSMDIWWVISSTIALYPTNKNKIGEKKINSKHMQLILNITKVVICILMTATAAASWQ